MRERTNERTLTVSVISGFYVCPTLRSPSIVSICTVISSSHKKQATAQTQGDKKLDGQVEPWNLLTHKQCEAQLAPSVVEKSLKNFLTHTIRGNNNNENHSS